MDNKNENWRKKHVKPKCDCKRKKEEKLKTWASSNWKSRKTKNTFFPIIKNHNSITTPKKSIPFFRRKNRWFINLIFLLLFFLSCSLPPIVFLSNFWQNLIMLLLDHYYYILLLLYANVQSVFNAYQITFWI